MKSPDPSIGMSFPWHVSKWKEKETKESTNTPDQRQAQDMRDLKVKESMIFWTKAKSSYQGQAYICK